MAIRSIRLPDIGEGIAEVELVAWHAAIGAFIREDELLASVMTDKATVEIPSLHGGRIVSLGCEAGEVIAVGAELARIEVDDLTGPDARTATATAAEPPPPIPAAVASRPEDEPVLASPSVRAKAREDGLDLRQIAGSGPSGRITHEDLDRTFNAGHRGVERNDAKAGRLRNGEERIDIVGLRRKIAEHMALAHSRIPHITIIEEVDVTALEDLRGKLNAGRGESPRLTILPFVTSALAKAFVDHPEMNAHYDDDAGYVTRFRSFHAGIATMTDAGLVVPVLRHAEASDLYETAGEIARLAEAARAGKASRDELSGSTFTITSLGPLGALATTPIINHPEVAILGVNKMAIRPMWDGKGFVPRTMMNISASFDHRVIDGWDAAKFVQRLKTLLETPAMIFIGR